MIVLPDLKSRKDSRGEYYWSSSFDEEAISKEYINSIFLFESYKRKVKNLLSNDINDDGFQDYTSINLHFLGKIFYLQVIIISVFTSHST